MMSRIYWLTGPSGSGKSTIAVEAQNLIGGVILDADDIRKGLNRDLSFKRMDVKENVRRIAHLAKIFSEHHDVVIVSCIAPYLADRQMAQRVVKFKEIYVHTRMGVILNRETGLYTNYTRDVAGKDFCYEVNPKAVVFDNNKAIDSNQLNEVLK
jgi:adenylylsulfate kinase-like enzyme